MLRSLHRPWDDLSLPSISDEESHSSLFEGIELDDLSKGKTEGKDSSAASQAGESTDDSGKRSVLLCFNENIRSATDVFHCHNEFIRDVAHQGNLILSPEEWQSFFLGKGSYGKVVKNTGIAHSKRSHDRMDREGLAKLRTTWCAKRYDHDHSFCSFAHIGVNRGWLRRDPLVYKQYKPMLCPYVKPLQGAKDCYVNMCPHGTKCRHSHSMEESMYHPAVYKSQPCRNSLSSCPLGDICPNTHADMPTHQPAFNRQGKRHHDHHHRTQKRSGDHSVAAGFGKLPEGSPMLYVYPAPLSEFEKTLVLPGLQAIFRDHSSSIYYSSIGKSATHEYEYGLFGFKSVDCKAATSSNVIGNKK